MSERLNDSDLVSSYALDGSEAAFRALVARHVNLVFATALRQAGDHGLAEEITQNVFIAFARKAPRLHGFETLAGWLHRTTVLEARARIRSELRRRHREQSAAELAEMRLEGESPFDTLLPLLDEGLLSLRESDREVLISRFMQERTLREVGERAGVDEDAARKRVSRGLKKLADFFEQRGFPLSTGAGAAGLLAASIQTAPPAVAAAAFDAGMGAGGAGAFTLLFWNIMGASNLKIAGACVVIALAPFVWQERALAKIELQQIAANVREKESRNVLRALTQEQVQIAEEIGRLQNQTAEAQARLASLKRPQTETAAAAKYQWNDASPLVRMPKKLIDSLHLTAVTDRRGVVSDAMRDVLQMTPQEAQEVQAAMDHFLRSLYAAQEKGMRPVERKPSEFESKQPDEVRVFEVRDVSPSLATFRAELFASLASILGPERFEVFRRGLGGWIPLDEEWQGVSSSMAVFNGTYRIRFARPGPGRTELEWGMSKEGSSMSATIALEEIPDMYLAYLQDWIELARNNALEMRNNSAAVKNESDATQDATK